MKIAIVYSTGYPPREGIGTYIWNLAKSLKERGHELSIITRGDGETHTQDGIEIHETTYYPIYPFHSHLHSVFVNRVIEEEEFDIINVHSPLCFPPKTDKPIVSTVHTPIETSAELTQIYDFWGLLGRLTTKTVSKRVEKRLVDDSHLVTGVSPSVCQILDSKYTVSSKVLPNAINPDEFTTSDELESYFLYVGRLAPRKGLKNLIKAFDQVSTQTDSTELRIVGTGPLEEDLKQMVSENRLSSTIQFEGFVSDDRLKQLYRKAYCQVLPSKMEGLPTVALEALASGTPVIATNVIGNRDIIKHEKNGLLVDENPQSLTNGIIRIHQDRELRDELASNARFSVVPDYTWEIVGEQAEKTFETYSHG